MPSKVAEAAAAGRVPAHVGERLSARAITKRFGLATALDRVDLTLAGGEIHALVGANGAGKSTLSKILCGHIAADEGAIAMDDKPVTFTSPRDALGAGIAMVAQETNLAPDLPVVDNIFLSTTSRPGRFSRPVLTRRAEALVRDLGVSLGFSLTDRVGDLSLASRQLVEILKALAQDPAVVIFDEPTTSLSPFETESLFGTLAVLAGRGKAIVLVSHRMEEIFDYSDRVTVLREGRVVTAGTHTADLTPAALVRMMVGRELTDVYASRQPRHAPTGRPALLDIAALRVPPAVVDVSLRVHAGEIVGLGGLVGAGRTEVLEALFGLRPAAAGSIRIDGQAYRPVSPAQAIRAGIGFVGEDRRRQGIVPDLSVMHNLMLLRIAAAPGMAQVRSADTADAVRAALELGLPQERLGDADLLTFSGGMQQKLLFARTLSTRPRILLLDEPTRGVDLETRSTIYRVLRQRAATGAAILVVSSDFEELLGICDRVVVISDGRSVAELPAEFLDVEKLLMFAAPKSSSTLIGDLLASMVERYGGSAFWVYSDDQRVFCFDCRAAAGTAQLLARGSVHSIEATLLPPLPHDGEACERRSAAADVVAVPFRGKRGHYLGHLGLAMPPGGRRSSTTDIVEFIWATTRQLS